MTGKLGLSRAGRRRHGRSAAGRTIAELHPGRRRRQNAEASTNVERRRWAKVMPFGPLGPERLDRYGAGGGGGLCGEFHGGVLFSEGRTARRRSGQASRNRPATADVGMTALPGSISAGWWTERPGLDTATPPEREPPCLPLAGPESCPRKPLAIELPAQRAGYRHPRGKLEPARNRGERTDVPASGIAMARPTGVCFRPLQLGSTLDLAARACARIVRNPSWVTWSKLAIPS